MTTSRRTLITGATAASLLAGATAITAPAAHAVTSYRTTTSTRLYTKPRTTSRVLTTIPSGVTINGYRTSSGYTQVSYQGKIGWVSSKTLTTATAPTPTPTPTTKYDQVFSANGKTSKYHVVADGVDFTKPWSILWYFDGDSASLTQSTTVATIPTRSKFKALALEANRRNLVFVPVLTPHYDPDKGYTWWADRVANGEYFRALALSLQAKWPSMDLGRQWLVGFSGGAEFISKNLLATKQLTWFRGRGATIVGGGGNIDVPIAATSTAFTTGVYARWHVSATDGNTANWPYQWGALPAARQGEAKYRTQAGFTKTGITVYPVGSPLAPGGHVMVDSTGTRVAAYDFAGIVAGDLNLAGIPRLR